MIEIIDNLLNKITMYRLVLYYLIGLVTVSVIFGALNIISFTPFSIVLSVLFILIISLVTNIVFARVFGAQTNIESVYISALILALIINPPQNLHDLVFLAWVGILSMASKYILAIKNKHIFNPVAIAVALTSFATNQSANWWIGSSTLMPFVFFGGLLIVRKIRREDLVFSFFLSAIASVIFLSILKGANIYNTLDKVIFHSSLFFLAFAMLTEPLTTPPTKNLQTVYGILVGILFAPQIHLGNIFSTPELALSVGNVFAYFASPKEKLVLRLKEKIRIASDAFDFIFPLPKRLSFMPGQYMEWTVSPKNSDHRGNRRYFTLSSSPTEDNLRIGVKFYTDGSSFKKNLLSLDINKLVVASQLAGDFVLPKDRNKKCVFVAGGIGITPFRSMLKFLLDTKQQRDIILMYSNRYFSEIVYQDILELAQKELNIKVIHTLTDLNNIPENWNGLRGRIDDKMIKSQIPDFNNRLFYLSGPHTMVSGFEKILKNIGVTNKNIKTDFFPGLS